MPQTFQTQRMSLRPVTPADLDPLVELDSDPEVMRYISGGEPNPRSVYEAVLLPRMLAYTDEAYGFFCAFSRDHEAADTERFLGWFHLRPSVFEHGLLELGYRLRRDCWGRGLATEGGRVLVEHGFGALGLPAIDACAMPENHASLAVMRKCGLRYVGLAKHPRVDTPLARYLLRESEYRELARARG